MSRILLAMVFAVGLAGAANAAVMQFSVEGVPVGAGEIIEVEASDYIMIDIWVELDPGESIDTYVANVLPTGPWDPLPADQGGVFPIAPWGANLAYFAPDSMGPGMPTAGNFSDFIPAGTAVSGGVVEWEVHIPDVPASTILNLEIVPADIFGPTLVSLAGVELPLTVLPLELHVTPEPATLGLLVLGGLAALRRRFA